MKRALLSLVVCATLIIVAVPAKADSITTWSGEFTGDLCTGGCGASPFGKVTLTQDGTSVDFYVELYGSNEFVQTGAGDFFNFKFNNPNITVGDVSGTGLTAGSGSLCGDGGGCFEFGVVFTNQTKNGGAGALPGPIQFSVTDSIIEDFLTPNNLDHIFVADIIGSTGLTGLVTVDGGTPNVPEPSTLLLLGLGLVGLGTIRKFRK